MPTSDSLTERRSPNADTDDYEEYSTLRRYWTELAFRLSHKLCLVEKFCAGESFSLRNKVVVLSVECSFSVKSHIVLRSCAFHSSASSRRTQLKTDTLGLQIEAVSRNIIDRLSKDGALRAWVSVPVLLFSEITLSSTPSIKIPNIKCTQGKMQILLWVNCGLISLVE